MRLSSQLTGSVMAAILVAAPIGDTTVLLLFSVSLECLLTLMLVRERHLRFQGAFQSSGVAVEMPFSALCRTAPHMRAHRPALPRSFVIASGS